MGTPSSDPFAALPRRKSWGDWANVAVLFVPVVVLLGILALSQIPLIQDGYSAREAEAHSALGAMKDRARVIYQRNPELKVVTKEDLGLDKDELNGTYFKDENYTCGGTPEKFWLKCRGVFENEPTDLECSANLVTGSATYNR